MSSVRYNGSDRFTIFNSGRDVSALHSGRDNERAQLYAFDMLAGDGEDQRQLPLSLRKTNLARLLKRRIPGVFIAEYEQGEIGRDLFRVACSMCLEGIVSKRRDCAYAPGKCRRQDEEPRASGLKQGYGRAIKSVPKISG